MTTFRRHSPKVTGSRNAAGRKMSGETRVGKQGPNINNGSWRVEFGGRLYLKDWLINGAFDLPAIDGDE
jgi:hypothetical protein